MAFGSIQSSPVVWRDMDKRSRAIWFNDHGDRIARARGSFAIAAEAYARELVDCGALEHNGRTYEDVLNDIMDTPDAMLAEEVREWLGA